MKVSFTIYYPTHWGQTLHVTGSIPGLGSWDKAKAVHLHYTSNDLWVVCVDVPDDTESVEYGYFLKSNGQIFPEPWERKRRVEFNNLVSNYCLYDTWQEKPEHLAFYSSAFTQVLFQREMEKPVKEALHNKTSIRLKVFAPNIGREQQLALTGNQSAWGEWNPEKAMKMKSLHYPEWEVEFDSSQLSYPVEYKFIVYSNNSDSVRWETGCNRTLNLPLLQPGEAAIVSGLTFREESCEWRGAGLVIPVFSLRSEESFGIGDFSDLKKMVDWVKFTGQRMIQTLPVNDTTMSHTWMDSYPYNAISIYALHPLYLNLSQMGALQNKAMAHTFRLKQEELNALSQIDYEKVDRYKWKFFRALFLQEGAKTFSKKAYKDFFREHQSWLIPYAAYSFLRDRHQTSDFRQWGKYAEYKEEEILKLCDPKQDHYEKISIYFYLQYHLHLQLKEAKNYAQTNGVILKGDIPVGISETSVEVWTEPHYFNKEVRAGAPPDDFSVSGQNWGFPTYNWQTMEDDDYAWWKRRFRHMAHYFDAYRIDHILGFFRIWEIPASSIQGLYAVFNPAIALDREEIKQAGFLFDEQKYTTAQVSGNYLSDLFGVYTQEVSETYLVRLSEKTFTLRPEVNTQQKIEAHLSGKEDFKNTTIKNALFRLANEVLFIPDRTQEGKFHPRIAANNTYLYKELSASDKQAFDYLYWDYFYHRQNNLWKEQGYKRLIPLISCTDMLVCGEDLGMIPACVPSVMKQLQILSLEIERMPKGMDAEFERLDKIPYHSVCTTSTHDMSTLRGWWEEDKEKTRRYFRQVLKGEGEAPETCTPEICRQIIENHLASPAMLTVIPLQDWMSIDEEIRLPEAKEERINIPSNPRHYWRYRMHLTIEELLDRQDWNQLIRKMIKESRRD